MNKLEQRTFKAIRRGRIEEVKELLMQGVSIEKRLPNGQTPLLYAIVHKQINTAKFLLEQGANFEARDNHEYTALLLAAEKKLLDVVQLLLQSGVDVNTRKYCYEGADECNPRHWSDSALIIAAKQNNYPMAKLLLEYGADSSLCEECEGGTALHYAKAPSIVQLLIDYGVDVNTGAGQDGQGQTPLMWAAGSHHTEKAKILLEHGADMYTSDYIDGTAAHMAAEVGCVAIVELLLKAGFDSNFIAPQSMSLLWHGRHVLSDKDGEKFLKLIIKYGYDINMKYRGSTDFMHLAPYKSLSVIKLLVKYGADIHALDENGKSVFGHIDKHSNAKNLAYLFSLGIKMTKADEESLFYCVKNDLWDILQVFLENYSLWENAKSPECEKVRERFQNVLNYGKYIHDKQRKGSSSLGNADNLNTCLALTVPEDMYKLRPNSKALIKADARKKRK